MIDVPINAWMRTRNRGTYLYAKNSRPVVWASAAYHRLKVGTTVYALAWTNSQNHFKASEKLKLKKGSI